MTRHSRSELSGSLGTVPSLALVGGVALAAFFAAPSIPGVTDVAIALLLGLLIANARPGRASLHPAVARFMLKRALSVAVVLLGAGVDLTLIRAVGAPVLVVISASVAAGLAVSWVVARHQGLGVRPALLVGVGTAICGASAIAAVAPMIRAKEREVGVALATVFGFNAIALLAYPVIGAVAGFDPVLFGTWAGAAVHDTASSVATGFAMGTEAGEVATVVKLARILFLIPLLAAIAGGVIARDGALAGTRQVSPAPIRSNVPWFIGGFVVLAILNALGWLGSQADVLSDTGKLIILLVVAAIGLNLRLRQVMHLGRKTFVTGLSASLAVAVVSLSLIQLLGIGTA